MGFDQRTGPKAPILGKMSEYPLEYVVALRSPPGSQSSPKQVKEDHLKWLMKEIQPDPNSMTIGEYQQYAAVFSPEQVMKVSERDEVAFIQENVQYFPLA